MKPLILFASNTEPSANLKLLISEANQKGFVFSSAILFSDLFNVIKNESTKIVLINAEDSKLEALELCRLIKNDLKGSVKVFVYMSNSSASEGSRFGLLNAEVEDEASIKLFCDKLFALNNEYIVDENIVCFSSLTGSSGASFTAVALASFLENFATNSLLIENSANFSIKKSLDLNTNLSLLGSSLESNKVSNDIDWFKSFVYSPKLLPNSYYLNLFNSYLEKNNYLKSPVSFLTHLADELKREENNRTKNFAIADSLKLLEKDLQGVSYSLFNEIIGLGSKLSRNFFIDIGSDYYSSVNKQFLHLAKTCLVFFSDNKSVCEEFRALKEYMHHEFQSKVVPVLTTNEFNSKNFAKISNEEWLDLLGEVPLIMPPCSDAYNTLIVKSKAIHEKRYLNFLQELAIELDLKLTTKSHNAKGILKFLNSQERFSLNA